MNIHSQCSALLLIQTDQPKPERPLHQNTTPDLDADETVKRPVVAISRQPQFITLTYLAELWNRQQ